MNSKGLVPLDRQVIPCPRAGAILTSMWSGIVIYYSQRENRIWRQIQELATEKEPEFDVEDRSHMKPCRTVQNLCSLPIPFQKFNTLLALSLKGIQSSTIPNIVYIIMAGIAVTLVSLERFVDWLHNAGPNKQQLLLLQKLGKGNESF